MRRSDVDRDSLAALGAAIRRRRCSLGFSQEELSYRANLDRSYIGGVERGHRNLSFTNLLRICHGLNTTVADLLCSHEPDDE